MYHSYRNNRTVVIIAVLMVVFSLGIVGGAVADAPTILSVSIDPTEGGLTSYATLEVNSPDAVYFQWQELYLGQWTNIAGANDYYLNIAIVDSEPTYHNYRCIVSSDTYEVTISDVVSYESQIMSPECYRIYLSSPFGSLTSNVSVTCEASNYSTVKLYTCTDGQSYIPIQSGSLSVNVPINDDMPTSHYFKFYFEGVGGNAWSPAVTYTTGTMPQISYVSCDPSEGTLTDVISLSAWVNNALESDCYWQESLNGETWTTIEGSTGFTHHQQITDTIPTKHYYRMVATNATGTVYSSNVVYQSYYPLAEIRNVSITPTGGDASSGVTVTLSADIDDYDFLQWQVSKGNDSNWQDIDGAVSTPYEYSFSTNEVVNYFFRVKVTNIGGTAHSSPVYFAANSLPFIKSVRAYPMVGLLTSDTELSADISRGDVVWWEHSLDGVEWEEIPDSSSAILNYHIEDTTPTTHYFRAVGYNTMGFINSEMCNYTTSNTGDAPRIDQIISSADIGGSTSSITVEVYGENYETLQWEMKTTDFDRWEEIAGATGSRLNYDFVEADLKTYQFRVKATSELGDVAYSPISEYIVIKEPVIVDARSHPDTGGLRSTAYFSAILDTTEQAIPFMIFTWQHSTDGGTTWDNIIEESSLDAEYTFRDTEPNDHMIRLMIDWNGDNPTYSEPFHYYTLAGDTPQIFNPSITPRTGELQSTADLTATTYNLSRFIWEESTDGENWGGISPELTSPDYSVDFDDEIPTTHFLRLVGIVGSTPTFSEIIMYDTYSLLPVVSYVDAYQIAGGLSGTVGLYAEVTNFDSVQWQHSLDETTWTNIEGATDTYFEYDYDDEVPTTHYFRIVATNTEGTKESYDVEYTSGGLPSFTGITASPRTGALSSQVRLFLTGASDVDEYEWQEYQPLGDIWKPIRDSTWQQPTIDIRDTVSTQHLYRCVLYNEYGETITYPVSYTTGNVPIITTVMIHPIQGMLQSNPVLAIDADNYNTLQWQESTDGLYTWNDIPSATTASFTLNIDDREPTVHYYRCLLTNDDVTWDSPVIEYTTVDETLEIQSVSCEPEVSGLRERVELFGEATGYTRLQWQTAPDDRHWEDIEGATDLYSRFEVDDTEPMTHYIRLLAWDAGGNQVESDIITYTSTSGEKPTISWIDLTPEVGGLIETVHLNSSVEGATSYQWQQSFDGTNYVDIEGATTSEYMWNVVDTEPTFHYVRLQATNDNGTSTSSSLGYTSTDGLPIFEDMTINPTIGGLHQIVGLAVSVLNATSLQWQHSTNSVEWTDIAGQTGTTLSYEVNDTVGKNHYFRCIASNAAGQTTSAVKIYTSQSGVLPTIHSASINPKVGALMQDVTLTSSVSAYDRLQWEMSFDKTVWYNITGATSEVSTYHVTDSYPMTHYIRLVATNTNGVTYSDIFTYRSTDTGYPIIYSVGCTPTTGGLDQLITLSSNVEGALTYQWEELINGSWQTMTGATTGIYQHHVIDTSGKTHYYRLLATNAAGTSISEEVSYISHGESSITFKNTRVSPTKGELTQELTLSSEVEGATEYQWQVLINGEWNDIEDAVTPTFTDVLTFPTNGTYKIRLQASNGVDTAYSPSVKYRAGVDETEGMMSIGLSVFLFILFIMLFIGSCVALYYGHTLAILPMVSSVIVCMILTAISGLGKVGDVSFFSGIVDNGIITDRVINYIPTAVVVVYGFITLLMVVLTIYILAQVIINLRREEEYTEDEYEG